MTDTKKPDDFHRTKIISREEHLEKTSQKPDAPRETIADCICGRSYIVEGFPDGHCYVGRAYAAKCEELERLKNVDIPEAQGDIEQLEKQLEAAQRDIEGYKIASELKEQRLQSAQEEIAELRQKHPLRYSTIAALESERAKVETLEADLQYYGRFASKFGDISGCYDCADVCSFIWRHFEELKSQNAEMAREIERLEELVRQRDISCDTSKWHIDKAQSRIEELETAVRSSIARADDHGDSWCSKPIRQALESGGK